MSRIQVLPDSVARRIAAGEVIERPASVVKELVENSLDAGARSVVVELDQGGLERIAVTDDGEGMSREEAPVAFQPHATSKIRSEEDLLAVATLGFRGEALPSIAAVSEVEVWTRRREAPAGTQLRIRAGVREAVADAGTAPGTRVEVRELFFNTPVRRKFLRSASAEASQVIQLVGRIALGAPAVGFTLIQNGREALSLPRGDLRSRIGRILGRDVERELHPIAVDGPARVEGFATHPHFSLANARSIVWFVNGRWVRDRMLQHALLSAYATLIPHGRFPGAVLLLTVAPGEVDVNVHPTKAEVRFRTSQTVYEGIHRAIRSAFGRTEGANRVAEGIARYVRNHPGEETRPYQASDRSSAPGRLRLVPGGSASPPHADGGELFPTPGPLSSLRVIGQLFEGYLVCQGEDEVVLIDQHAAHERVAFERLRAQRSRGRIESQPLLVPQTVEVGAGEVEILAAAAGELAALGLEVEPFGEDAVVVRAVPALLPAGDTTPLVRAIVADLAEVERTRAVEERGEELLATIACHSVVRVGQRLSEAEARSLLAAMDEIDLNTNCPHGRPVTVTLSRTELERRFGR
ncbi:MAG: DNA mismatch repair endonuclease MutL [Candidatus Binatia bacterium]